MEEKILNILLVEDDPDECRAYIQYIDHLDDVHLAGVTNNADKALQDCIANLPDAVILDLELHNGGGNGVSFLLEMGKAGLPVKPYVLIATENISKAAHAKVRQLGADFIMTKSQENYSPEEIVEFLRSMKTIIHDAQKRYVPAEIKPLTPEESQKQLVSRIAAELNMLGVSPKMLGRKYLIDAITLTIEGHRKPGRLIALKYDKNAASVERAMQHTLNHTWHHGNANDLQTFYTAKINSRRGMPTLSEFIFYFADKLANF
ncbi:MAG: response regulator [Defluviitaleaceae bacterium]|nr:response regulator [Defluviitaleaceae bacterium]